MKRTPSKLSKQDLSTKKIERFLIFSSTQEGLEEYAEALYRCGLDFDQTCRYSEAKEMLRTGEFSILIADVTDYDDIGRKLINWTKHHLHSKVKTFGFTRTELPTIFYSCYKISADKRFYYETMEKEVLTEMMFHLFLNHTDLAWVDKVMELQKKVRSFST